MEWPGTLPISDLDKLRIETAVDGSLRQRFIQDPAAVLRDRGINVAENLRINVVEDSNDTHTVTLPPFVGDDTSVQPLAASSASTWECTTCTPTSPICAGSLASLTCVTNK